MLTCIRYPSTARVSENDPYEDAESEKTLIFSQQIIFRPQASLCECSIRLDCVMTTAKALVKEEKLKNAKFKMF